MSAGHRPIFNFQFSIFNLMKRQHLQDPVFKFEDTAIVLLQTDYLNYQFIYALNQACRLEMERIDDIELADGAHPCFLYFNEVSRLTYVVLDVPIPPYNMMLLIRGRDAWDIQESLYKSLTEEVREPDPTDIRDHLDWELLNELKSNIFSVDTFGFSPTRGQGSSLVFSTAPSALRARQTFLHRLRQFTEELFEALEWHLCED